MQPKIGVIGCGYWGKNLVRNFYELNVLALVCDPCERGHDVAKTLAPEIPRFSDLDDALSQEIDAVVVATPAETHFDVASKALRAGKDVFVEKPLAVSYDAGYNLVELAEKNQKILMVGHVLEYHPAVTRLVHLIRTGRLGKLQYIYSNRLSLGKVRREENILWSFAPHDIAVILRIMDDMPLQVVACGGNYVQPNIADVTVTNLLFNNGVRAHIYVSWLHPFKEQRLVVVGSKMMATFDDVTKELSLYDQRVEINAGEPVPIKSKGQLVDYNNDEPLKVECRAFIDAVLTRQPPLTDGQSGLRVLQVLETAQRSMIMNGQQVTLPKNGTNAQSIHSGSEIRYENLQTSLIGEDAASDKLHLIHE